MSACLYCRKSDRMRGEFCTRCLAWISNGPPPARYQHWFTGGQPGEPVPEGPPADPPPPRNPYGLPPDDRDLSNRQREILARLRSTGEWQAPDAGVAKALVRRGLAESRPGGPRGKSLFRAALCPGPYAPGLIHDVESDDAADFWGVLDTRKAEDRLVASFPKESEAWLKAESLNRRFQADAAVAEMLEPVPS